MTPDDTNTTTPPFISVLTYNSNNKIMDECENATFSLANTHRIIHFL